MRGDPVKDANPSGWVTQEVRHRGKLMELWIESQFYSLRAFSIEPKSFAQSPCTAPGRLWMRWRSYAHSLSSVVSDFKHSLCLDHVRGKQHWKCFGQSTQEESIASKPTILSKQNMGNYVQIQGVLALHARFQAYLQVERPCRSQVPKRLPFGVWQIPGE